MYFPLRYKLVLLFSSIFIICFFIGYDYAVLHTDKTVHSQNDSGAFTVAPETFDDGQELTEPAANVIIPSETCQTGLTD